MAEQHTPTIEALVRLADSLPAVIKAVCRERQLRPILMRLLQHASDAAKRRAVRIAIINRIGRLITSRLSLDEILQTAIETICGNLHFADLGLMLVDPANPEMLVLRAKTGIYSAMLPKDYRQSIHQGIIGAAARARQRILLNDVTSDPRYIPARGMDDVCTELAVPVVVGDRLLGVLNVESTRRLSEEDAVDLEVVADQLGVAIDNARLFARTQQTLAETQLLYETSRRMSTSMDVDEVIGTYLEQVAARGRYVCTVMLYAFDEAGQRTAAIIRGRWTPWEGRVHLAHEETLFRIVQEALNNVVKHARARRIEITLRAVDGLISLTVRDDGQGFTSEPIGLADGLRSPTSGGFGLRIMRERAEALRGRIDVISAPGKGTIINVRLPQEDEQP